MYGIIFYYQLLKVILLKDSAAIILSFLIFCTCIFGAVKHTEKNIMSVIADESSDFSDYIFILDAGHGGEDGGAVAFDGTLEKDLNLMFCNNLSLYFDIFGIDYMLIRDGDYSVGDTSLPTIRKRKASDIYKRYETINSFDNSILLSIHQNMFSAEKYSGTQVFYDGKFDESEELSKILQFSVKEKIQPENNRKIKKTDKSIYLLYEAKRPSVMVECGFMSNLTELEKLRNSEYQSQFSYVITKGLIQFLIT